MEADGQPGAVVGAQSEHPDGQPEPGGPGSVAAGNPAAGYYRRNRTEDAGDEHGEEQGDYNKHKNNAPPFVGWVMWQREMARALPIIAGARPPPLKGEAFFGRTPVKGSPQGGELAELARPEGPYPAGAAASLLCILLHLVQPEIGDAVPAVLFQHCIKGGNRLYG